MKRNNKRDFEKFKKRNTHKRVGKEKMKNELLAIIEKSGVGYSSLSLRDSRDDGRRGRVSAKKMHDEVRCEGIFQGTKSGFGFVTLDNGYERDIFIPEGKCYGAISGDYVEVIYHTYRGYNSEEKTEGRIVKIIKYGIDTVVGELQQKRVSGYRRSGAMKYIVEPDDSRLSITPYVKDLCGAKIGDKVAVKIERGKLSGGEIEGKIVSNFGKAESKSANYEAILFESGIECEFSEEELLDATRVAKRHISEEGRLDLTNEKIITIDSESAKDLDDAVSVKKVKNGWHLGVHIADVSAYVNEKTPLDRAVMRRGTSVYFTDKVVPMLPPVISNGVCSLNAGEKKLTLSAIMHLDESGNIIDTRIEKSIIQSSVRGVYSEVNKILSGEADGELTKKYKSVTPMLKRMNELYEILAKKSEKRGALELETHEAEILLNESGEPCDIVYRERGISERIIEQFMLCANEAVACELTKRKIPLVYRVHEAPPEEKLDSFLQFVHNLGYDTSVISREKTEPRDFQTLLKKASEDGTLVPVSYTMLRSMSKAKYSDIQHSHFGLAIENYCHFTSPIRRLSDLATHRIIHRVLFDGKSPEIYRSYAKRAAAAATDAELRAISAERRIENLYKTIYMSGKIGEEFAATIVSITSFGIFAELDNTCEGLIPISELPGLFIFDERNLTMRQGNAVYRLGDRIKVRLEEADTVRGKLRLSLLL